MFPGNQSYEEGPKQFVLVLLKKYEKNIQKTVLFWTNLSINIIHQKVQKSNVFLQKNQ